MAIPEYQTLMLPLLELASDGQDHEKAETLDYLAEKFSLTEKEKALRSGKLNYLYANYTWAKTYLKQAGLLSYPKRGVFRITELGRQVLATGPQRIDKAYLSRFDNFSQWTEQWNWSNTQSEGEKTKEQFPQSTPSEREGEFSVQATAVTDHLTPYEHVDRGYKEIRVSLASEILEKTMQCTPEFFEQLVVDLLVKMGYGGSLNDAGQVVGKSGDGGIDGIIKEDKLGLGVIYVQAKRWQGTVGAGPVRDFSGSLDYHGAKKGVFITTSTFTKDAHEYVSRTGEKKIVLIGGPQLAQLMINHDIGVSTVEVFPIKRLDSDYFEE